MKKLFFILSAVLLLASCSTGVNKNSNIENENKILPNGIVLTDEKYEELYNFCNEFNEKNNARYASEDEIDDEYEENFIKELTEKYGDEAKNYYGVEVIESKEEKIPCLFDPETEQIQILDNNSNARYTFDSINPEYYIEAYSTWKKHWSLTWTYYSVYVSLHVKNYYYDESFYINNKYYSKSFDLKTDKAYYVYKDSVTNKSGWEDWTKFDNPEEFYPKGDSNADKHARTQWEIAEANRGCFEVSGKKKKGWLPKVKNQEMTVVWYDDFINGGSEEIIYWLD